MKVNLISCDASRPDRRAITNGLEQFANAMDTSLAAELTDILLDGSPVEVEFTSRTDSALRMLRKLQIDYEIQE